MISSSGIDGSPKHIIKLPRYTFCAHCRFSISSEILHCSAHQRHRCQRIEPRPSTSTLSGTAPQRCFPYAPLQWTPPGQWFIRLDWIKWFWTWPEEFLTEYLFGVSAPSWTSNTSTCTVAIGFPPVLQNDTWQNSPMPIIVLPSVGRSSDPGRPTPPSQQGHCCIGQTSHMQRSSWIELLLWNIATSHH